MTRIGLVLTAATFVLAIAACGGGDATSSGSPRPTDTTVPSSLDLFGDAHSTTPTPMPGPTLNGRAVVQADLSSVASPLTTIDALEQVIQDRLGDAGLHSNISQTSDAELTIDFTGARSIDFVKQVIEAQNLNFRQPIIQANGTVTCKTNGGVEFSVQASNVRDVTDSTGTRIDSCTAIDGQTGTMEWEPAQADVNGATKTLTQAMIDTGQAEIKSSQVLGSVLQIAFNQEGSSLFAAVTKRLITYPLGIFLGDTLLSAPTVQVPISDGTAEIAGVSDDSLAIALAVIKGGELPVPVSVTSIALNSPAP
jgi:preprotein translocase subunit SecD